MTTNSSSTSGIRVTSLNKLSKINASSDAFIYYTNLSKDWATKTVGTVDGEEYSSKYYAVKAAEAESSAKSYIDETKANFRQGIGLVKSDENNAIKTSTDGIYVDLSDLETDIGDLSNLTTDTKTNLVAAINEHETLINQKINVNSAVVDGQWIHSYLELVYSVTCPTTDALSYSLASYLPNDNYIYEVIITGHAATGNTSGNTVELELTTDIITSNVHLCYARTRTASNVFSAGVCTLPVGSGRVINVEPYASAVGTFGLSVVGYRRIGTNS